MTTLHDFTVTSIDGGQQDLREMAGKTALVVNVASKCGFTPQYEGLEQLYRRFADRGFVVLGFPCDQFMHQEPGDEAAISEFCSTTYGVTFPMFAKLDVNGDDADPLYQWLRKAKSGVLGGRIKWNFTKFLIGGDGTPLARYAPTTKPDKIASAIDTALAG